MKERPAPRTGCGEPSGAGDPGRGDGLVTTWHELLVLALTGCAVLAMKAPAQERTAKQAVHDARHAQRSFESYRRRRLPLARPHGKRCEVTIGRLCYWDDNDDDPLPPEPAGIAAERERLRATFDDAARLAPGDDWIAGQRVRYALESGDTAAARALVANCAGSPWWCAALAGLVWHEVGDEAQASRAFTTALRAMPDTLRCAWLDVRLWLPDDAPKAMRESECGDRPAIANRLFWLTEPLLTWRPDAARNEWFARQTLIAITEHTALPSGLAWGDDIAETGVRFGWPRRWAREEVPGSLAADPFNVPIVGHEPRPSWSFVPEPRALVAPATAAPDDWHLSDVVAPPMRYAPVGIETLDALPVQLARFRRDTLVRVVAVYDASDFARDPLADDALARAATAVPAAVVAAAPESALAAVRVRAGILRGAIAVDVPPRPALTAVEVVDSAHARAARWRAGLEPLAHDALVSDLLVGLAGNAPVPATLADAIPLATASLRFPVGSTLALYWECYAPASPTTPVRVTLRLVPHAPGLGGRIARALGLSRARTPLALEWMDQGRPDGATGRSLRLSLPAIGPGRYRLELVVARDTVRGRATREIELAEP